MKKLISYVFSTFIFLASMQYAYAVEKDGTKSIMELSAEARVSSEPVDFSNAKKFSVSDNDFVGNGINFMFPDTMSKPWVKPFIKPLDFNPEEHVSIHSIVESFLDLIRARVLMLIAMIGLICWSIRLVYVASTSKEGEDKKKALKKAYTTTSIMLGIGLVLQPDVLIGLIVILGMYGTATLNYAQRYLDSDSLNGRSTVDDKEIHVQSKLDFYAEDESNLLINATIERVTKHALINAKSYKFATNFIGFSDDSVTKQLVFNNIENNIVVEARPVVENGAVKTIGYYWKEKFEGYDENKYGPASLLFTTSADGMGVSASFQDMDRSISKLVRTKATIDGAKVISASENQSIASTYEDMIYAKLKNNEEYYDVVRYADSALISRVGEALIAGKKELAEQLKFEGLTGQELKAYEDLYSKTFSNSVQGYNFDVTQLGKYKYAQTKEDIHRYNCSQNYETREAAINSIPRLNSLSGTWSNTAKAASEVDWQCTVIKNGKAITFSTDPKDEAAVEEFKLRSTASAIALNLLKSNVISGVEYGDLKFNAKKNPMTNVIVQHWDKGWISAGFNTINLGKLLSSNSTTVNAIRNNTSVSVSLVNNDIAVDLEKLYGDKKTNTEFAPTEVLVSYQPFIFEPLLNPAKAQAIQSYQDAQNLNSEEATTGDYLLNLVQSSSTILTNAKSRMGLPPDLPMNKGFQYCNSSLQATKECNLRATGTVATAIYGSEVLTLGVMMKTFVVGVKMYNSSDIGWLMQKTGFSDGKISKIFASVGGGFLKVIGKVVNVIMAALNIVLVPIDTLSTFLIIIGFLMLVIQYLPMVIIIIAAISYVITLVRIFIIVIPLLVKTAVYSEPRHLLTVLKVSIVDLVGLFFLLIGHYVMIHCINLWSMGNLERELYGIVAPDGGVFSTMIYLVLAGFVYLVIHAFFISIVLLFKKTSETVTGEQSTIIENANVMETMKKMVVLYAVERAIIDNGIKKVDQALEEKHRLKLAEAKAAENPTPTKNVDVEGKR